MAISTMVFWGIIVLIISCLILFPEVRKKIKVLGGGFLNIFVEDWAKTPEGADAVYQQAISETQESYNRTNDTLLALSGKLDTANKKLSDLNDELATTEKACENFVKNNKMNEARLYSEKREELLSDINRIKRLITELEPMVAEAQQTNEHFEKKLITLKKKRKEVVEGIKLKIQLKEAYSDMDKLKNVNAIDKLLETVDDGYTSLQEYTAGAKVVNDNKLSTKISKAENEERKLSTSNYLEELKNKYNNK